MIVISHEISLNPATHLVETIKELLKEFGIVLISVWGVSLFYERFLAERHFRKFQTNLEQLIRQGESNAAVCEGLGVLEIHRSRRSFEEKHSFATQSGGIGPGEIVRITGRSLVFSLYGWQQLKHIVENGATLNLCLCDPSIRQTPLQYLSGYSPQETDLTITRVISEIKPWLKIATPRGTIEIRYHQIHLLDSLLEVKKRDEHWVSWDLNFGGGTEERQVFYLKGDSPLGRNLTQRRYGMIWDKSRVVFRYTNGNFEVDKLNSDSGMQNAEEREG